MKSQKKSNNHHTLKILFSLILILSFSTSGFSQTVESDKTSDVIVPEQTMKQVVRRILIWYFKPRKQKKIIYLSKEGLKKSWLPEIEGIEFQLLSEQEGERKKYYSFTDMAELSKDKYNIGFAFGCQCCGSKGDVWHFRILKRTIRVWKKEDERIIITACSYNSDYFETPPPIMKKQNQ